MPTRAGGEQNHGVMAGHIGGVLSAIKQGMSH